MNTPSPVSKKLAELNKLRTEPESEAGVELLRAALADRSNRVVARAAEILGEARSPRLLPELLHALRRLYVQPLKWDAGCLGKCAIMETLVQFNCDDLDVYRQGIRYVQLEPRWGGAEDSAARLRAACAAGMAMCASVVEALHSFAELLVDPCRPARIGAARAIAGLGHPEGAALLRLKLLVGDADAEVIGECCAAFMELDPLRGFPLVVQQLKSANEDVCVQVALALGEARHEPAFEPLKACWERHSDPSLRGVLLTAIGLLRCAKAIEFLLSLIGHSDRLTGAGAMRALAPYAVLDDVRERVQAAVAVTCDPTLERAYQEMFRR